MNQRWGVVTNGLKVDLYEIDYNDVSDYDMVAVSQLYTETYGEGQSYSEALENPRMFVRDPARNLLVLPMVLQDEEAGQTCSVEFNASGEEIYRNCYETTRQKTTFAGMKWITVSVADGIEEEFSYDYQDRLRNNNSKFMEGDDEMREEMQDIYPWQFRQLQFRVGYLWDAMYAINNSFAHMVIPWTDPLEEVYVDFVE